VTAVEVGSNQVNRLVPVAEHNNQLAAAVAGTDQVEQTGICPCYLREL